MAVCEIDHTMVLHCAGAECRLVFLVAFSSPDGIPELGHRPKLSSSCSPQAEALFQRLETEIRPKQQLLV